jgi:imidazolonepropionase
VSDKPGLLVHNAAEIATLAGGVRRGEAQRDIALLVDDGGTAASGPAVASYEGRIVAVGRLSEVEAHLEWLGIPGSAMERLDAQRGTVTPGLVDPHTHLLFAGTRHAEVEMRQRGHSYLEILAAGGGILQTVRMTRAASDDELLEHGRRWLREMLSHGVTTLEAKSGYGLDMATELRLLSLAEALSAEGPLEVIPTYLGAHAVAPEFRDRPNAAEDYVEGVITEQLPAVAEQGIARFCDIFCEQGVFDAAQSRRVLAAARDLGLTPRLHADQIHNSGGARLAAELEAASADHLAAISDEGIEALAGSPTVATLLPVPGIFLAEEHAPPARKLIDAGVPVAVGTDFNPGTAPAPNAALAMALAVHQFKMTPAEALAAATINAAAALRIEDSHGPIEDGKHADLAIWNVDTHALLPYWVGADLVRTVVKRGKVVFSAS